MGLTMDIFPTLCEVAGAEANNKIDGISLLESLKGQEQDTDSRSVFFMRREGWMYAGMCYYAARKGNYKLLQNTPFEPLELFNIANDPAEKKTLNNGEPDMFNELRLELSKHIHGSGSTPWQRIKSDRYIKY